MVHPVNYYIIIIIIIVGLVDLCPTTGQSMVTGPVQCNMQTADTLCTRGDK